MFAQGAAAQDIRPPVFSCDGLIVSSVDIRAGRPPFTGQASRWHKDQSNFEVAKRENSVILMDENYKEKYEGFDPASPESYILFSLNQSAYQEHSLRFAQKVEDQFKKRVGRSSRGVKQAGFLVLWMTTTPSVLVETGFITNKVEEEYKLLRDNQEKSLKPIENSTNHWHQLSQELK